MENKIVGAAKPPDNKQPDLPPEYLGVMLNEIDGLLDHVEDIKSAINRTKEELSKMDEAARQIAIEATKLVKVP